MSNRVILILLAITAPLTLMANSCQDGSKPMKSASGVQQAHVELAVGPDGKTTEQRNVADRLTEDNKPGAIKHLYVISPYSGQVIIYSTVRGKVTSSSKRLTPTSVAAQDGQYVGDRHYGILVNIGGLEKYTSEVLQDDGTYGTSDPYIYWFDQQGRYRQHYMTGGQIIHVSDQPLAVKSVTINMELTGASSGDAPAVVPVP